MIQIDNQINDLQNNYYIEILGNGSKEKHAFTLVHSEALVNSEGQISYTDFAKLPSSDTVSEDFHLNLLNLFKLFPENNKLFYILITSSINEYNIFYSLATELNTDKGIEVNIEGEVEFWNKRFESLKYSNALCQAFVHIANDLAPNNLSNDIQKELSNCESEVISKASIYENVIDIITNGNTQNSHLEL